MTAHMHFAALAFGVKPAHLLNRSRSPDRVAARALACILMRMDGMTWVDIGRRMGRSAATCQQAGERARGWMCDRPGFAAQVLAILDMVRQRGATAPGKVA